MSEQSERINARITDAEFVELIRTFEALPPQLEQGWTVWDVVHREHEETIPEVRKLLEGPAAKRWAKESSEFIDRLNSLDVTLAGGLEIVGAWVFRVRELLRACGATDHLIAETPQAVIPEQTFHPDLNFEQLPEMVRDVVVRLRVAIRGQPEWKPGKPGLPKPLENNATYPQIRKHVRAAEKTLRDALWWMYVKNEYRSEAYTPRRWSSYVNAANPPLTDT